MDLSQLRKRLNHLGYGVEVVNGKYHTYPLVCGGHGMFDTKTELLKYIEQCEKIRGWQNE